MVNLQYKQSIADYQAKLKQADITNNQIRLKFEDNKAGLAILNKSQAEIAAMISKSTDA